MIEKIRPNVCRIVEHAELPIRATPKSACFDVKLCLHKDEVKVNGNQKLQVADHGRGRQVTIFSGDRALLPTGLIITPPDGYKMSVKPRSGLAFKSGLTVINSPGTVDADYANESFVLLINHTDAPVILLDGERIAQLEFEPVTTDNVEWNEITMDQVKEFKSQQVRQGGIGHTGTK